MELTVHAPSRLDGQDRHLLVQSAAHRLVVHLRLLSDSVLKCRAGARVGAVPHRYVVVKETDDVPEGGVAVTPKSRDELDVPLGKIQIASLHKIGELRGFTQNVSLHIRAREGLVRRKHDREWCLLL